jgi:hypothetical protein
VSPQQTTIASSSSVPTTITRSDGAKIVLKETAIILEDGDVISLVHGVILHLILILSYPLIRLFVCLFVFFNFHFYFHFHFYLLS